MVVTPSCNSSKRVSKQVREAESMQEDLEKETLKEYEVALKKHNDQQSDYSKQLIKDMKKRERQNNRIRKRTFWDRIFNRSCK